MLRRTFLFSTALATIMPSIMRDAFAQGAPDTATKGKLSIWLGYPETLEAFKQTEQTFKTKYPNVQVEILTFELA